MNEIPHILEQTEKVVWEGKPKYIPYFLTFLVGVVIIAAFAILVRFYGEPVEMPPWIYNNIHFIGIAIAVVTLLYGHLSYRVTHYAITDKRIVIQSGVVGRDFKSIDYEKVRSLT